MRFSSHGLPTQPKASGERWVCREWKETNQCTGFIIRSPIVPPRGSDSDLRAWSLQTRCSQYVLPGVPVLSTSGFQSKASLDSNYRRLTPHVFHHPVPAKPDIHNRSHELQVAAFYLAIRRVQIRESAPEHNVLHPGEITGLLAVQHRGFCSPFPSVLCPLPKANRVCSHTAAGLDPLPTATEQPVLSRAPASRFRNTSWRQPGTSPG